MQILSVLESQKIRKKYIQTFIDTNSDYYTNRIEKLTEFSDGLCYTGYLWDCLKNPRVILEDIADEILKDKKNIYVMWDIHSSDNILIPDYWKYPKSSVLCVSEWSDDLSSSLPEDLYLFDNSFAWSLIYTHETGFNNDRYCVYVD